MAWWKQGAPAPEAKFGSDRFGDHGKKSGKASPPADETAREDCKDMLASQAGEIQGL